MTKKEKLMVTRAVMAGIGTLCMLLSINENLDVESTSVENALAIIGFILCIPMYSFSIVSFYKMCKSIEKDEKEIKKIDAELERLSK
ncbi:MAG: hypothetical protein ACLT40_00515 [Fusobacterium sp.]